MADSKRPFWEMSKQQVDAYVEAHGLAAWRTKIAADRADAPRLLAKGTNPWLPEQLDAKRQNIISSLAPELAARLKAEAGYVEK